jgi:hypothetical protein
MGSHQRSMPAEVPKWSPGVWHDWFNEADLDAVVRAVITPGERFAHMIETLLGLAREAHVNRSGMSNLLQLALTAQEFSDVSVLRRPPPSVRRVCSARWERSHDGAGIAGPT